MVVAAARTTLWRIGAVVLTVIGLSVAILLLLVDEDTSDDDTVRLRFITAYWHNNNNNNNNGAGLQQQQQSPSTAAAFDSSYYDHFNYWQQQHGDDWKSVARYALEWKRAVVRAARDNFRATASTATAIAYTVQPFAQLTAWLVRWLVRDVLYDRLLVRGLLSETAIRQVRGLLRSAVAWQRQLTAKQIAAEVGVVLLAVALHLLYKFLQRRQYGTRLRRRVREVRQSLYKVSRSLVRSLPVHATLQICTLCM